MKTIAYKFFGTRDQARGAAKELNGKFVDLGADAAKGERWAVQLSDVINVPMAEVESHEIKGIPTAHDLNKEIALLQASMKAAQPQCQVLVVQKPSETVTNLKGKKVQVHYKKSVQVLQAA